jgi:hypothetical protein
VRSELHLYHSINPFRTDQPLRLIPSTVWVDKSEWRPCFLFLFIAIDSKPSANERELIFDKVGQFLRVFVSNIGYATLRSAPSLNRKSSDFFCSNSRQQPLGAATSVKPTWLQRSPTLLSMGPPASPKPNLWKLTERLFSTHSWRRPLSNGQLGLFNTQLTVNVRSEVTALGDKLKVAVLSIHM